ncbi:MAG: FAD-dependent oxidoreductase, partial [Actinomycetota bacterium]
MPFPTTVTPQARASLADVRFAPFWLDTPDRPQASPALTTEIDADLVVVGGGFSGLWTAYLARERFPHWSVVVLEGDRIGGGASGRNGGFIAASLTHGLGNGRARGPDDMPRLTDMGRANLDAI